MSRDKELRELPLSEIECRPQVRGPFAEDALDHLAQSLSQVGLLQPIFVRRLGERWVIIDGERRYRAALKAGWPSIPALVADTELGEGDVVQRQLVCNVQRTDLSPIETARAIERLIRETSCGQVEAAAKVSLSPASVSKLLALLTLPKEMQDLVHGGDLAASTAYEIAKTADPKRRAELIASASKGRLKRDGAAARSRSKPNRPRKAASRSEGASRARVVIPAGGGRSLTVTGTCDLAELLALLEFLVARLRTLRDRPGMDLAAALSALASERPGEEDSDVRQAG